MSNILEINFDSDIDENELQEELRTTFSKLQQPLSPNALVFNFHDMGELEQADIINFFDKCEIEIEKNINKWNFTELKFDFHSYEEVNDQEVILRTLKFIKKLPNLHKVTNLDLNFDGFVFEEDDDNKVLLLIKGAGSPCDYFKKFIALENFSFSGRFTPSLLINQMEHFIQHHNTLKTIDIDLLYSGPIDISKIMANAYLTTVYLQVWTLVPDEVDSFNYIDNVAKAIKMHSCLNHLSIETEAVEFTIATLRTHFFEIIAFNRSLDYLDINLGALDEDEHEDEVTQQTIDSIGEYFLQHSSVDELEITLNNSQLSSSIKEDLSTKTTQNQSQLERLIITRSSAAMKEQFLILFSQYGLKYLDLFNDYFHGKKENNKELVRLLSDEIEKKFIDDNRRNSYGFFFKMPVDLRLNILLNNLTLYELWLFAVVIYQNEWKKAVFLEQDRAHQPLIETHVLPDEQRQSHKRSAESEIDNQNYSKAPKI